MKALYGLHTDALAPHFLFLLILVFGALLCYRVFVLSLPIIVGRTLTLHPDSRCDSSQPYMDNLVIH